MGEGKVQAMAWKRACAGLCVPLLMLLAACSATYQPRGAPTQSVLIEGQALVVEDGVRLPLRQWVPAGKPRAVVIALHGMNDYSNAFDAPARYWRGQGIATYAYDQRGFGASALPGIWPGTETLVADLDSAVEAIAARHPGVPLFVLGESMGGALAITAVTAPAMPGRAPLASRLQGVVLSAPALWGRQSMNLFYRMTLWLAVHTVPSVHVTPPRGLKIVPSDNIDMLRGLGRDPLVLKRTRIDAVSGLVDLMSLAESRLTALPPALPVLVLYGAHEQVLHADSVAEATASLKALAERQPVQLKRYPQGYHMLLRDLCGEAVWQDVAAWMAEPAAVRPVGACPPPILRVAPDAPLSSALPAPAPAAPGSAVRH